MITSTEDVLVEHDREMADGSVTAPPSGEIDCADDVVAHSAAKKKEPAHASKKRKVRFDISSDESSGSIGDEDDDVVKDEDSLEDTALEVKDISMVQESETPPEGRPRDGSKKAKEGQQQSAAPEVQKPAMKKPGAKSQATAKQNMETGKKDSAGKTKQLTWQRITAMDREDLTQGNKALYVTLPKSIKSRRAEAMASLSSVLCTTKLPQLLQIIPSGGSYFGLLFPSTSKRDEAISKLQELAFDWEGRIYSLIVRPFGSTAQEAFIWHIYAGLLDSAEDVLEGVKNLFEENGKKFPKASISPVTVGDILTAR